ncbi:hypothetical protein IMSHALPRED_002209 [Imshaugia aleurites]|uniref:F-box domain-containing protein n=1 Tax=Imshaugia aleurites TaxID=172621 RepID=A0A8H3J5E6_9LECA|nr:hypothetical protein IMSHALPRED_002209 [Imshaugia aleurites]
MPAAQITNLAPELISQVFCSMEDFSSATNLSKTSHKFQAVWQQDIDQISHAIRQHSIECTDQVYEYLSASIEAEKTILRGDKREIAIAKTLILMDRASNADKALSKFVKLIAGGSPADAAITATTRRDFIKAYHRAWTLAARAPQLPPYQMVIGMDVLELLQLGEVLDWMMILTTDPVRAELGYSYNTRDLFTQADYSEAGYHTWSHVQGIVQNIIRNFTLLIDDGTIFQKIWGEIHPEEPCNALMYDTHHPEDPWYPRDKRLMLADFVHLFPGTIMERLR